MLNLVRRAARRLFGRMDGTQFRGSKPLFTQDQLNKLLAAERAEHDAKRKLNQSALNQLQVPVQVGEDGRCKCTCGTKCALGRTGMSLRCTKEELGDAGVPWTEEKRKGRR